jgi:uracil-DNA glycosylase
MMDLHAELALLRDLGYTHLDLRAAPVGAPAPSPAEENRQVRAPVAPPENGEETLDDLGRIARACTKCKLAGTRTQVVYGVGNPNADLMFIGEAPGRDLQGEPFVGRAGQLLTDIIKAMKLTRDDVYITNVVKCRPPDNRNPEPDELESCRPYIRRQIALIKPRVIVTLGKFALQSLLERSYSITAARGNWLEYEGIKVMPTFHPAYLLRTPAAKKEVWQDMKKVMAELGIQF